MRPPDPAARPAAVPGPVATYRLQLRDGMDFAAARARLPAIAALGASHLYLSPILAATAGSTHGYDVTDPGAVDPALGGREGFEALARAAHDAGLAVVVDIVPNHAAFSLENPWLRDVLRHGPASRWAPHFDIDWSQGRLVLPFLPEPFEAVLEAGGVSLREEAGGWALATSDLAVPLAPGTPSPAARAGDPDALRELHAAQPWRLAHWELGRDGVTHRRFFNVTGLIGLRVEEPEVFDDTHALILDLVRAGHVDALRVDHVDGLADPGAYLARLRAAVGEDVPVWVEKILMGDERLPDWPVAGTTGYEAGAAIARALTDAGGLARLDALWREVTGETRDWPAVLLDAKRQVIRQDLAAEHAHLRRLAEAAARASGEIEPGEEALREAVLALLVEMPRYRTYLESPDEGAVAADLAILDAAAGRAAGGLVGDGVLRWLAGAIGDGATEEARRLRCRFQQVTGALMAKAQEDTAFFRFTRCLAHCEVGAEPGDPHGTPARFAEWAAAQSGGDLVLTSSHDTKRAEDARARLIAMTHHPEAFAALWEASRHVPGAEAVEPATRWYVVQSILALWEPGTPDLLDRIADHLEKALREGRELTTWTHPRPEAETVAEDYARALARAWQGALPPEAAPLLARADDLAVAQLALKLLLPGVPDFYQGAEGPLHHLTDPDNRRAPDWDALDPPRPGLAARKATLTRELLALRRAAPALFAGPLRVEGTGAAWRAWREGPEGLVQLAMAWAADGPGPGVEVTVRAAAGARPAA